MCDECKSKLLHFNSQFRHSPNWGIPYYFLSSVSNNGNKKFNVTFLSFSLLFSLPPSFFASADNRRWDDTISFIQLPSNPPEPILPSGARQSRPPNVGNHPGGLITIFHVLKPGKSTTASPYHNPQKETQEKTKFGFKTPLQVYPPQNNTLNNNNIE